MAHSLKKDQYKKGKHGHPPCKPQADQGVNKVVYWLQRSAWHLDGEGIKVSAYA
jgi:hypothetical protein